MGGLEIGKSCMMSKKTAKTVVLNGQQAECVQDMLSMTGSDFSFYAEKLIKTWNIKSKPSLVGPSVIKSIATTPPRSICLYCCTCLVKKNTTLENVWSQLMKQKSDPAPYKLICVQFLMETSTVALANVRASPLLVYMLRVYEKLVYGVLNVHLMEQFSQK